MDLLIIGFWVLFCLSLEDIYMTLFRGSIVRNHGNLQNSPLIVKTGRPSVRIHVNLQDFPFRGYAGSKKSCKFTGFPVQRLCW